MTRHLRYDMPESDVDIDDLIARLDEALSQLLAKREALLAELRVVDAQIEKVSNRRPTSRASGKSFRKRLMELLDANPQGLTAFEVADTLGVSETRARAAIAVYRSSGIIRAKGGHGTTRYSIDPRKSRKDIPATR